MNPHDNAPFHKVSDRSRKAAMFLIFIGVFLVLGRAPATTYYVSPSGDDTSSGTENQPWKSLAKVHNSIKSGDTIYFRGGTWLGEWLWPGKTIGLSNANFLAYPGETPVFANLSQNANKNPALFINSRSSNLLFRGLTWSNNWMNVNIQRATRVTFDNCTFGHRAGTNTLTGFTNTLGNLQWYSYNSVVLWSTTFNVMTNCTFARWGEAWSGDDDGCPLALGSIAPLYSSNCWGNVITDCRFEGGGHDLIEIYAPSNVIRRCTLYNPPFMVGPDRESLWGNRHLSTMTEWAQPTLVEDCNFGYCSMPVDSPNTVACLDVSASRLILRRNRFFDNVGVAVSFYQKGYGATPSRNYVYHNSILWSGNNPIARDNRYFWYNAAINWTHSQSTNNAIVNNAIWKVGPDGTDTAFRAISTIAMNSSRFAGNLPNSIDPLWMDTNTSVESLLVPDMRLRLNSPAINSGSWLATITSESDTGTSLTLDDAGYFYDGWSIPGEVGDTIQLQGQTATAVIIRVVDNTLTLDRQLTWTKGQGIALPYTGSAPDIGAYDYGKQSASGLPAPANLRVRPGS